MILSAGLLVSLGCQASGQGVSVAEAAEPASSDPAPSPSDFDVERAHEDFVRLTEIGTRYGGARGASRARKHLERGLSQSGFQVVEVETPLAPGSAGSPSDGEPEVVVATHLFARVEGDDRDAILLVAPYTDRTTLGEGRDAAARASGPAVLLELARIDQRARRTAAPAPMAWWIAMVDGDGAATAGAQGAAVPLASAIRGSDAFASWLVQQPEAQRIRLVVFVDRMGDAPVRVARDLHSNRSYREVFFSAGAGRGHDEFAPDRPLSAPVDGQRAFMERDIAPVVAIIGEPRSPTASMVDRGVHEEGGATRSDSLLAVGDTLAVALARIGERLARIDAFRRDPLRGGPGEITLPGIEEPGEAPEGGGQPAVDHPATPQSGGARE